MAAPSSSDPREKLRPIVPKLIDLTEKVLFGDVWERPGLSKRDRSLITVATLVATYRPEQLPGHLERALNNGVTKDEIIELITHLDDLVLGHAVVQRPLQVTRQLLGAIGRHQCRDGDQAAVTLGQAGPLPDIAEQHLFGEVDQ